MPAPDILSGFRAIASLPKSPRSPALRSLPELEWSAGLLNSGEFSYGATIRTQTGEGTSSFCPVGFSAPVWWSIRKTTIVSLPWFSANRPEIGRAHV